MIWGMEKEAATLTHEGKIHARVINSHRGVQYHVYDLNFKPIISSACQSMEHGMNVCDSLVESALAYMPDMAT